MAAVQPTSGNEAQTSLDGTTISQMLAHPRAEALQHLFTLHLPESGEPIPSLSRDSCHRLATYSVQVWLFFFLLTSRT